MKYKSCKGLCLVIGGLVAACSHSDWEQMQFTDDSPINYVVKNNEDDGFIIRDGMLVASSEKLLPVLDSGVSYPFELYLIGDGEVVKYFGRTNKWHSHRGILLVSDLRLMLSNHAVLAGGFSGVKEIALLIKEIHSNKALVSFKVRAFGIDKILRSEQFTQ